MGPSFVILNEVKDLRVNSAKNLQVETQDPSAKTASG